MSENKTNPMIELVNRIERLKEEQETNIQNNKQIIDELKEVYKQIDSLPEEYRKINQGGVAVIKMAGDKVSNKIKMAGDEVISKIAGVDIKLSDKDQQAIQGMKDNLSLFKQSLYVLAGLSFLSALILLGSGYMAKKWYDTSVQTRQEVRAELIEEIKSNGNIITSKSYLKALENEKGMIGGWFNANPEDSKSYNTHRKAIMNLEENQKAIFFETPTAEDIQQGGNKSFFD